MNTRSVLLSIQSMVLNENPLYNEPGIKFNSKQIDNYNNVLYYCVFNIAILLNLKESRNGYLENNKNNQIISFDCFKNIIGWNLFSLFLILFTASLIYQIIHFDSRNKLNYLKLFKSNSL